MNDYENETPNRNGRYSLRAIAFRYGPACAATAGSLASEAAAVLPGRGVAPRRRLGQYHPLHD